MAVRLTQKIGSAAEAASPPRWSLTRRVLLSIVIAIHLLAVFIGPFAFATLAGPGMASPFAEPIRGALRPYLDFAFLDHGYFFFAPNPGPSHLLRAELEFADGRPPQLLQFPDRNRYWSRLLYHRHFMLAEQLHADFTPPEPPPEIAGDPEQLERWRTARKMYEVRRSSFLNHLHKTYGASRVTLTRVEHIMITPADFSAVHRSLTSPETYIDLPESAAEARPSMRGGRP